jgi:hypothetical protein
MNTEVGNGGLVDEIMIRISGELRTKIPRGPSLGMVLTKGIKKGDWHYDRNGSSLDTRISRWGMGAKQVVKGPSFTEWEDSYRERLESELRAAVRELQDPFFDER